MSDVQNHGERAHSLLSASGSSMWMNCTPSARKNEHLPDKTSSYAMEGTLAHELAEIELKKHFGLINIFEYKNRLAVIEDDELYNDEMPEFVDVYVTHCIEEYNHFKANYRHVEISIEEKIDLTEYIPEGFGANDFVIIADGLIGDGLIVDGAQTMAQSIIVVIDLKYGRGITVSAIDNSQLKLYGLGSVYKHRLSYNMSEVKLTIVMPRKYSVSSFIITVDDLENWANTEVKTKAAIAYKGEGELNPGHWCKFCKFKPQCRAIYNQNLEIMKNDFGDPDQLTEAEIKEVFERKEQIVSWLNSIDALVMDKLLSKQPFEGYKLVKGRSVRKINDAVSLAETLETKGFKKDEFMAEPKILGITALEKLVGKKVFETEYNSFVSKTEPKPTVASSDDKRDSFFSSAENDFL